MRYEIYMDANKRWFINDNLKDTCDGGIFKYESDAQKQADILNQSDQLKP